MDLNLGLMTVSQDPELSRNPSTNGSLFIGEWSSGNQPVIWIWITAGCILLLIIVLTISICVRRQNKTPGTKKHTAQESMTALITASHVTETTSTLPATNHELSIPAFLELQWGVQFRVGARLASGGFGSLYRCQELDQNLLRLSENQPLIVKRMANDINELDQIAKDAFWQEVALMWRLRDFSMFCKIYGFSTEPVSIIMKYYALGDLNKLIKGKSKINTRSKYSKLMVLDILKQISEGIRFLHELGIAHGDVKPQNCLLEDTGTHLKVVICDFGISRLVSSADLKVEAFRLSFIRGASIRFCGPEVFFRTRGFGPENFEPQIFLAGDVYALSMTLLNMLERKSPWTK